MVGADSVNPQKIFVVGGHLRRHRVLRPGHRQRQAA